MFDFAKLLLFVSFGYALIAFYEAPLPGIGVSFSNLITDQADYFQTVLEARAFDNIYRHFDELSDHFMQPDPWSILANLIYWTVLLLIAVAKAVSLAVIAFGLIASAVCALLGPIFVPFFIVRKLDWLFWGWLQVVHPVLVHPGRGDRVPDDLRAVRLPVRDDAAADDHAGGVRHLRPAGVRGRRHVLHGHPAGAVADAIDLLGSSGESVLPTSVSAWPAACGDRRQTMPRRFPDDPSREQHVASPEFSRLLVIGVRRSPACIGLVAAWSGSSGCF